MLVTKDTRDEAYLYSARRKERKMHVELDRLRRELRQKIFVGQPAGETFAEVRPAERLERLPGASSAAGKPRAPRAAREPRQAELPHHLRGPPPTDTLFAST